MGLSPGFSLEAVSVLRRTRAESTEPARKILDDITVRIDAPVTLVRGPSGSGKTSLIRLLNGLDSPTAGRIEYEGRDLEQWPPQDLRRRVGLVAQQPPPLASTGWGELELAAELAGQTFDRDKFAALASQVDLTEELLAQDPADLSVGERQRLAIIRALAAGPATLVLDEPTSAQDDSRAVAVHEMLAGCSQSGLQLIIVEHRSEAERVHQGSVTLMLAEGRLVS